MHILVVDDDIRLARQISSAATEAGHDPVVMAKKLWMQRQKIPSI